MMFRKTNMLSANNNAAKSRRFAKARIFAQLPRCGGEDFLRHDVRPAGRKPIAGVEGVPGLRGFR